MAAPCAEPICISTRADRHETSTLIATSGTPAVFHVSGLGTQGGAARVVIDGVHVLDLDKDGEAFVRAPDVPARTPSGELWVEQGGRVSNRLPIITPAWVTSVSSEHARSGEEVTVVIANAPPVGVDWRVVSGSGCSLQQIAKSGDTATVTALWDSDGTRCALGVEIGLPDTSSFIDPGAPGFTLVPTLTASCHGLPGEACRLVGTAFGVPRTAGWTDDSVGVVTLDGIAIALGGGRVWSANTIQFPIPELAPGEKPLVVTRSDGLAVEGTITVLGWQRVGGPDLTTRVPLDHEGTMTDVTVGFLGPGNAFVTTEVLLSLQHHGSHTELVPFPNPELPSGRYAGGRVDRIRDYDICSRPRATAIPPNLDRVAGAPAVLVAARRRGAAEDVDWDGLASRPCEPGESVLLDAEALPGSWPAFSIELEAAGGEQAPRVLEAGLARFSFASDPPIPDPAGRPGRWVPVLGIRDDRARTTALHLVYSDTPEPLLAAPLEGRGTLHEAGERIYLAGGEPGFDGFIHEVRWRQSSRVEPPVPGLSPSAMPVFSGDPRGRLWVLAMEGGGAVLHVYEPGGASWSRVAEVPEELAVGASDLAVLGETPFLAGHRDVGLDDDSASDRELLVHAFVDGGWRLVHEPVARFRVQSHVCVGRASTEVPPDPDCGRGLARVHLDALQPTPGAAAEGRLWATTEDLYVRYRVRHGDARFAYVARLVGGLP